MVIIKQLINKDEEGDIKQMSISDHHFHILESF